MAGSKLGIQVRRWGAQGLGWELEAGIQVLVSPVTESGVQNALPHQGPS